MYKQYFKQALNLIKQNKLLSVISILGTALAIAMIMVIAIIFQLRNADYTPEVNRSRVLYVWFGESWSKSRNEMVSTNNLHSLPFIKECLYPLKSAEAVTAMADDNSPLSVAGSKERIPGEILFVDVNFWKLFDYEFLAGRPFSDADFQSGTKQAVLREEIARKLFRTTDVVGKVFYIKGSPYTVCGVVGDMSKWASSAYADVFVPYTSQGEWWSGIEQTTGPFRCLILAESPNSFENIQREVALGVERFNQHQKDYDVGLREQPYTHFQQLFFTWDMEKPHVTENVARYTVILLLLLLVPAINLSGITLSRMQRRMEEIGVRRSFGATRRQIVGQVLSENLVLTLLGGLLGIVLSYVSIFLMRDWLLNGDKSISLEMVASPVIFVLAFIFCLILNLLSAGIPAWRVAKKNITDALQ